MKKAIFAAAIAVLAFAAGANAWWVIQFEKIDTCADTDSGLDFLVQGTLMVSRNSTHQNFTDYCISNFTVGEYACSDDVPGQPLGYADLVGENCNTTNSTLGICSTGRCI